MTGRQIFALLLAVLGSLTAVVLALVLTGEVEAAMNVLTAVLVLAVLVGMAVFSW